MAKSKIIPSRAVSNRNIGGSSISPGETISGQTNDQKVIVNGRQYDGGDSNTTTIRVDNVNHIIYADVKKVPGKIVFTLPDGTAKEYDGSIPSVDESIVRIRLDGYSIEEVSAQVGELKRYKLLKNGEQIGDTIIVPRDADVIQALENEIQARINLAAVVDQKEDKATVEVEDESLFTNFIFENNREVTCNDNIDKDITLTLNNDVLPGFISMLTITNMSTVKTITINNLSSYTLRVVSGLVVQSSNTYVTKTSGKKIIFARCDGVDVEVLIIEELS